MSYSTKSIDIIKCSEKTVTNATYNYTFNWNQFGELMPFDEIKIDGLIIETQKDELFEFEQEDVLKILYNTRTYDMLHSKIPGWLLNKLCVKQYNCEQFSVIPNCTYIKIPIDMLINNNNSQIKRIPINNHVFPIKNIEIKLISKLNIHKIYIIIKNYMWHIMPFIKNNVSLRLFNTCSPTSISKYVGLFMHNIPKSMIYNYAIPYNEKSIKNNSQLLLSQNDQKYKEALWQLYLILPNDIIRKIKSYLDDPIYWMPYEPTIEWTKAKHGSPMRCTFESDSPMVRLYSAKLFE